MKSRWCDKPGALLAVGFEWILKGPPTIAGDAAAQGRLDAPL
jgi:hypothetical protein